MQVHLPCLLPVVKVLWKAVGRYCPATSRFRTTHSYPSSLSQLKTSAVGVKKVSPIRRARPDEEGPRAPQVDRRRRREERAADNARRLQVVAARPIAPAAPLPDPAQEYPQIEVPADSYHVLRQVLTSERIARPGTISWEVIGKLFSDIGFQSERNRGGGSVQRFSLSQALRDSQASHTLKFRSEWIQVLHCWAHPGFPRLPSPSLDPTPECLKLTDTSVGSHPTDFETPST